jgi:hypothetical protein
MPRNPNSEPQIVPCDDLLDLCVDPPQETTITGPYSREDGGYQVFAVEGVSLSKDSQPLTLRTSAEGAALVRPDGKKFNVITYNTDRKPKKILSQQVGELVLRRVKEEEARYVPLEGSRALVIGARGNRKPPIFSDSQPRFMQEFDLGFFLVQVARAAKKKGHGQRTDTGA